MAASSKSCAGQWEGEILPPEPVVTPQVPTARDGVGMGTLAGLGEQGKPKAGWRMQTTWPAGGIAPRGPKLSEPHEHTHLHPSTGFLPTPSVASSREQGDLSTECDTSALSQTELEAGLESDGPGGDLGSAASLLCELGGVPQPL